MARLAEKIAKSINDIYIEKFNEAFLAKWGEPCETHFNIFSMDHYTTLLGGINITDEQALWSRAFSDGYACAMGQVLMPTKTTQSKRIIYRLDDCTGISAQEIVDEYVPQAENTYTSKLWNDAQKVVNHGKGEYTFYHMINFRTSWMSASPTASVLDTKWAVVKENGELE